MARAPSTPSSGTVLLQPQAQPVDTFEAPPRTNPLLELAQSLAPLSREVDEMLSVRAAKQKEDDIKQADALFVETNGDGIAEATRRGLWPAHTSPTFVKHYKQLEGDAIGRRLRAGWQAAYDQWAEKGTADDAALKAKQKEYVAANIGTDDPEILAAVRPHLSELVGAAIETHSRYRSGQFREEALRANLSAINSTLDDADTDGLASGKGTDYAAAGDAIERQRQAYIASGGTASDFDENGMKLIAAKAVELRDPKLLDFFKRKVPGEDYTYGDTPVGSQLRQTATDHLETIARQEVVDQNQQAERQRKAQADAATRSAIDALAAGQTVPEEVLAAGSKADADFRVKVGEWKANLAKGRRNDPLVMQIKREIVGGAGMDAVRVALPSIESPDDLSDVVTFAKSVGGDEAGGTNNILNTASVRETLATLEARTKATGSFLNPITGTTPEGDEVMFDFRMMALQWAKAHPDAPAEERETAIARMGKIVKSRLFPDPADPNIMQYRRDANAVGGFENPYETAAPVQPENAQPQPAAQPKADDRTPQQRAEDAGAAIGRMVPPAGSPQGTGLSPEAQSYFDSFSPEEQAAIRNGAAGVKGGLPAMVDHLQRTGQKPKARPTATAPDGTPIDPIAYHPSQPARPADLRFLSSRAVSGAQRPDSFTGMRPEFASGLEAMLRAAPPEIAEGLQVSSGYRSPERQAELWADALRKYGSPAEARKWVAPPGRSGHNHGHAADLSFNGKRLDDAPANVREWVHQNAARFGLAFPLGNEAWHVELAGARSGGGKGAIARRTFTPKDAESFLSAAMSLDALDAPGDARDNEGGAFVPGDVSAGRLLDLIGQAEAGGNYNAVFGNEDATRDLSRYSLDDILNEQAAAKNRNAYSTAIGKYQFLHKTLRGLKEELGLSGSESFTPELQDRLAVALLRRRGWSAFRAGKISKRQFALRLSQEWATLPDPNTGRSFYHDDGVNRARAKSREVYAALGFPIGGEG
ncbi:hypothetical protein GCM10011390_48610 [Aureimonas endophytica]|uniref:D-alanyl-D-alanine carboxypeptidase-like core domain-containing protein n=1 Tax=Aureimonas endophytica TaxID=2027858 RepID=A0A917A353_9HYPH|nr:D-alanyl-D-alanine carboxypeptidase family protein [Aureimonas endophytica]GGE23477.1 hypothetical protein GCM10011390_48610 [Aureimonas endophytica]